MSLRVGFLGVGHVHTASYMRHLLRHPDVSVIGLYDWDAQRAATDAERWGIPALGRDELIAASDAVVICAENVHHRALFEAAAGKVRAVLCEKPIATTMTDARAMLELAERTGTRLQIAFPVRYAIPLMALKEMLARGDLGTVHTARATNHGSMPGGWFVQHELSGGGAVLDHTVHVVDALRWLWPGVEVTEVYAEVGRDLLHPHLGSDDAGLLSFTLSNGVMATLDTSWSRPPSYPIWGDVTLELIGDQGFTSVDVFSQNVALAPRGGAYRWAGYGRDLDGALIDDFVDMAQGDRAPSITGEDGLRAMEVALAAYESERTGQPVAVG
ncbi:MAG: Gfo/Idh/MocA family oxidoreductase [Anaerolineae bacterium]|nr:Gfo/Idh/MocA family oxidoreductase [Anaerolineae bacterium]